MEAYERSERISVFLRKDHSDRGKSRLSKKVNAIIEAAIKKIYLKAERPDVAAVVEEVRLHFWCHQRHRSIRHAKASRRQESRQSHRRALPFVKHN